MPPLNPQLFQTLHQIFQDIIFANEGESMITTRVIDARTTQRRTEVLYPGEYYRVRCPFCGDLRHRLWINHRYGQRDIYSGRPMNWLACCHNETKCMSKSENRQALSEMIFGFRNANARVLDCPIRQGNPPRQPLGEAVMPGETVAIEDLPANHPAVQYMVGKRGYPMRLLSDYNLRVCVAAAPQWRMAQDRIVIPIYIEGKLVGWQCRYVGDLDWRATGMPKYYTMPGMKKGQLLYNMDRAKYSPFVVVVEGTTDAMVLGDIAVASLGCSLSGQQRQLVSRYWHNKPIILLFDPDAATAVEETRDRLLAEYPTARVIDLYLSEGGVDPGSMTRDVARAFVYAAVAARGLQLPSI